MAGTSVKGVGTMMDAFIAATGNAANAAGAASEASFQDVWNHQTKSTFEGNDSSDSVQDTKSMNHQEEALKAKEKLPREVKQSGKADTDTVDEEKAAEVLGTAANELMQQVADTFGMSLEEVQQLMNDLGMSALDLLNADKFSAMILMAGGVADTFALLTNEELYADYKQLMGMQQELLEGLKGELNISDEQLAAMLENAQEMDAPDIEITAAADENVNVEAQNVNGQAAQEIQNQAMDGKEQTEAGNEKNADNGQEQFGNLLLQNLKADAMQPGGGAIQSNMSVWDTETQEIMRQVMDYMKLQIRPDVTDLEMQLHPESLGTLQIHISSKAGVLTANFVAQDEAVKSALESQMIQLKESFAEQGVKVEAIEVTVQTHEFERNLDEQGRERNQNETEKKSRPRRINLNAMAGMEDVEELTQEEELVAEMMAANGSTVDFTA